MSATDATATRGARDAAGGPVDAAKGAMLTRGADPALRRRRARERRARLLLGAAASLTVLLLAYLVLRMLWDAWGALADVDFWASPHDPRGIRAGESGILDAVLTSLVILGLTMLIAVPIGLAAGVYLHEYAGRGRAAEWIRATVANLAGVPSVVYGLLGLAVFVRLWADLSGQPAAATNLAAALTLAVLVLPILIVATEEALKTVPQSVRQASLAMGATRWQTVRHHVLPYALPGILTGMILSLSRAAGETAPLLVLGVPGFLSQLSYGPMDQGTPLQARAFFLARDARDEAQLLGAGAVVVLLLTTLLLNLGAILVRQRLGRRIRW